VAGEGASDDLASGLSQMHDARAAVRRIVAALYHQTS
jgi:hypothetical protein